MTIGSSGTKLEPEYYYRILWALVDKGFSVEYAEQLTLAQAWSILGATIHV